MGFSNPKVVARISRDLVGFAYNNVLRYVKHVCFLIISSIKHNLIIL